MKPLLKSLTNCWQKYFFQVSYWRPGQWLTPPLEKNETLVRKHCSISYLDWNLLKLFPHHIDVQHSSREIQECPTDFAVFVTFEIKRWLQYFLPHYKTSFSLTVHIPHKPGFLKIKMKNSTWLLCSGILKRELARTMGSMTRGRAKFIDARLMFLWYVLRIVILPLL